MGRRNGEHNKVAKPISLFSGYAQKENRVTNYCLLVLKMIYEENPKYLGEVLTQLVGEDISAHIGVEFRQQERRGASVPDGVIFQSPLTIYVETKNFDWFYDDQLLAHLRSLIEYPGHKVLLALGKFDALQLDRFTGVRSECEKISDKKVLFQAISFEHFIDAVQIPRLSKNLSDAIADFRAFLDEEDLLSSWDQWLDVVNCAGIPQDIIEHGVYMCPATGGAYKHDRCRFFGMYRNKSVERVAEIEAVIDVDLQGDGASLLWNNSRTAEAALLKKARTTVQEGRPEHGPTRVFLLGPQFETTFRKDTPGGMQGSKQYFNVGSLGVRQASELADKLRGRRWSEFRRTSVASDG